METVQLGRLERHDLRTAWDNEATAFTPWLARPENLAMLGEVLGMELELEAKERAVGPFKADLLCRNAEDDHWVLIENQLERTDHGHLGQLLTYASGLDAVTIVWIAATFTEEHRAALDWLNRITADNFHFFGVEVELWRIDDSPAAPKFNIVSKPNEWLHAVSRAAHAIEDGDLSETRAVQRNFWAALNVVLDAVGGPVAGYRTPQPQYWMRFPIGRSRINLSANTNRLKHWIRAGVRLGGPQAKTFFRILESQKDAIERELGYALHWEELPDAQDSRIACYLNDTDPEDETDWPRQHEWLTARLNELHGVFAPRISVLGSAERGQLADAQGR
jgi:hypothetical protein